MVSVVCLQGRYFSWKILRHFVRAFFDEFRDVAKLVGRIYAVCCADHAFVLYVARNIMLVRMRFFITFSGRFF